MEPEIEQLFNEFSLLQRAFYFYGKQVSYAGIVPDIMQIENPENGSIYIEDNNGIKTFYLFKDRWINLNDI